MQSTAKRTAGALPIGISERHSRACPISRRGERCRCTPSYRAFVSEKSLGGGLVRETFTVEKHGTAEAALEAADDWRRKRLAAIKRGDKTARTTKTFRQAAEEWMEAVTAEPPRMLNRSGEPFKPSVVRGYANDLRLHVLDDLGAKRLDKVHRRDLRALVQKLLGQGLSGSRIRNVLAPVRVIFREALENEEIAINPTRGLKLPKGSEPRERSATPREAAELIEALPPGKLRAAFATAAYAGLRMGELRGLRWHDVDLANGVIRVRHSFDERAGLVSPKSKAGRRDVGIVPQLHDVLVTLKAASPRGGRDVDFCFHGRHEDEPLTPSNYRMLARAAWAAENARRAKEHRIPLKPLGFHEARHTYVSLLHDSGVPLERIADYVGHSSTWMTAAYRHLVDGRGADDTRRFGEYLAQADRAA